MKTELDARQSVVEGGASEYSRLRFHAMGTACDVMFRPPSDRAAHAFPTEVRRWVERFEARYSRYRPDSIVSRINASAGAWVEIDAETEELLALCEWCHWMTAGIFDPTGLPLILLWDYKSLAPVVPSERQIRDVLDLVGWKKLERVKGRIRLSAKGMGLDLGGIGKEYAVDRVVELGLRMGIEDILVDFGQDVRVHGKPVEGGAWRIGLQDPQDPGKCWGGVAVKDRAVATSGDYFRHVVIGGTRCGHILDLRTGYPVANECLSVSVIAPTCTQAGVLSTAAFILGPEQGVALIEESSQAAGCVVSHNSRRHTRGFDDYFIREKRS